MDKRYIRDHQVIERYLRGTLTPDEEQAFEEAYLGDPEVLAELELTERMMQGFAGARTAARNERSSAGGAWLGSKQWAIAASVVMVVSLAVSSGLYLDNLTLRNSANLAAGMTTRLLPVVTVRGEPDIVLEAPSENEWAVLLVDPGLAEHDSYRATVARRSGERLNVVWSANGLEPEYQDQLALGMPGRLLEAGEYEIEIAGRMDDWPAERSELVARIALRIEPRSSDR